MRTSSRLKATITGLLGLWLAVAPVAGCGPPPEDDEAAATAPPPAADVTPTQRALPIGGGGTTGIKGCTTNCSDGFVKCAQSGADWNTCEAIYRMCLLICGITGAPVVGGSSAP